MKDLASNLAALLIDKGLSFTPSNAVIKQQLEKKAREFGIPLTVTPCLEVDDDNWLLEIDRESEGIIISVSISNDRIKDLVNIFAKSFLEGPDKAKDEFQKFMKRIFIIEA